MTWFFGRSTLYSAGVVAVLAGAIIWMAGARQDDSPYSNLGQAPEFTLIDENGKSFSLSEVEGRVVLVSFMFTRCYDLCPILTSKLATMQEDLEEEYREDVYFVSVTVDPEYDHPEVLKEFATNLDYSPEGWSFLTGRHADVRRVANAFGVLMATDTRNTINHNLLTTVIDPDGVMRVQYLGERFDTDELLEDIRAIADHARS